MGEHNEKVEYIHLNPVRAGLARRPEDWPWSSVHVYTGSLNCRPAVSSGLSAFMHWKLNSEHRANQTAAKAKGSATEAAEPLISEDRPRPRAQSRGWHIRRDAFCRDVCAQRRTRGLPQGYHKAHGMQFVAWVPATTAKGAFMSTTTAGTYAPPGGLDHCGGHGSDFKRAHAPCTYS